VLISNRLIAAGLLVFYGIPMAIGPSWHRHDERCDASACQLTGSVDASAGGTGSTHEHQHDHKHRNASGEQHQACEQSQTACGTDRIVTSEQAAAFGSLESIDARQDCVVCAFYTQSQLASRVAEQLADEALLTSITATYHSVGRTAYAECQPRGPPVRSFL